MRRTLAALALVVSACSAEQRGPGAQPAPPLSPALAATALPVEKPAQAATVASTVVDLEEFTPLLALPELRSVAAPVGGEDYAQAVERLEAEMAENPPPAPHARAWQMLLGRLRERAGRLDGARASYELAARESWPLTSYAWLAVGRTALGAGDPKAALAALARVPGDQPIASSARLLTAEAAALVGDHAAAIATWRAHLASSDHPEDWANVSLRLADALIAEFEARTAKGAASALATVVEAHALARRVAFRAASTPDVVERARQIEKRALGLLPAKEQAALAGPTQAEQLARLEALVDAGQASEAHAAADAFLAGLGKGERWQAAGCEASLLRAKSIAREKEWGKASEMLGDVARFCREDDLRARALYLAGKYADSDKRFAAAVRYYQRLEEEVPEHRLADDARLRAALSYLRLGAEARYTELLNRMPDDYPAGDMVLDGIFGLAVRRIERGDWRGALSVLDRAALLAKASDGTRGREFAGRERYFRARARIETGEASLGYDEFEAIVREIPFSYYALHAYSRLHKKDAARAGRARDESMQSALSEPFRFSYRPEFDQPGFSRALELLRLGDVEAAHREIEGLELTRRDAAPEILWGVALLYERAGASKLSQAVARGLLTDWLQRWPGGDWEKAWQLAFPRPHHRLVQRYSQKAKISEALAYAVMREESAFDAGAVSPAQAYGLMQLIEPTARHVAKPLGLPADPRSLLRPSVNIALGCTFLGQLSRSFDDNPLLVIPGYNAGPGRPRRWQRERPEADFDVWVELIPFNETRRYTKRVLASRAAYAFLYQEERDGALYLPLRLTP